MRQETWNFTTTFIAGVELQNQTQARALSRKSTMRHSRALQRLVLALPYLTIHNLYETSLCRWTLWRRESTRLLTYL